MATQCCDKRAEMAFCQAPSQLHSKASPPKALFSGSRRAANEIAKGKSDSRVSKPTLHFKRVHGTQGRRLFKANFESVKPEQISKSSKLLSSIIENTERNLDQRLLHGEAGSFRCISACTYKQPLPEIPCFPMEGTDLLFQGSPLRTMHSPLSVSGADKLSIKSMQRSGDSLPRVSGRHNRLGTIKAKMSTGFVEARGNHDPDWFPDQPGQIPTVPLPGNGVAWSSVGFQKTEVEAAFEESGDNLLAGSAYRVERDNKSADMGEVVRTPSFCSPGIEGLESSQEASWSSLESSPTISRSPDGSLPNNFRKFEVVDLSGKSSEMEQLQPASPNYSGLDRCLRVRVGRAQPRRRMGGRVLDPAGIVSSHEHPGIEGSTFNLRGPSDPYRVLGKGVLRQFDDSSGLEETRILEVTGSNSGGPEDSELSPEE